MRYDEISKYLLDFGPYQKRTYFLVSISFMFAAFHKFIWVFLGATPKHRCRLPIDENFTSYFLPEEIFNGSIPWDEKHDQWSSCELNTQDYDGGKPTEYCQEWVYDDSQYISTVVTQFNLVCHKNWMRAVAYSLYIVGEFLGAIVIGNLSDRIGRRKVFLCSLILIGIFGVLAGLIHNYYAFVILRLIVGMFTQASILTGYVLGLEYVGPSKRDFAGVFCNFFFGAGYVVIAGAAYLLREWHHLQIALSIPAVVYCICVFRWIPESARWLLSVNRTREARIIIEKAAKINKVVLPAKVFETELTVDEVPKIAIRDLVRNIYMVKIIFCLGYMWLVNSAVYYGLSLNTSNLGGNDYLNSLIAGLIEFPAYAVSIFAIGRFGRRIPTIISMVVGGLALLLIIFVPKDMKTVTTTLAMIGKFGITISYANVFVFAAELYPTQIRNVAMGINSTFARIGGFITPFILLLRDLWQPLPLVVLGAMSVSAGLLALFLPETNKQPMPETLADVIKMKNTKPHKNGSIKTNPVAVHVTQEDEIMLEPMINSSNHLKKETNGHV